MSMTKKDFKKMAVRFSATPDHYKNEGWMWAVTHVALVSKEANPRFDVVRFLKASGMPDDLRATAAAMFNLQQ